MYSIRGVEIAKVYTCPGTSKLLKVLVHRKFFLSHIEEQIMYKDLSEALTIKNSVDPGSTLFSTQHVSS